MYRKTYRATFPRIRALSLVRSESIEKHTEPHAKMSIFTQQDVFQQKSLKMSHAASPPDPKSLQDCSRTVTGHSFATLGHSWPLLGSVHRALGPSWAGFGSLLSRSWPLLGDLGAVLGRLWAAPGLLLGALGRSWGLWRRFWIDFGPFGRGFWEDSGLIWMDVESMWVDFL